MLFLWLDYVRKNLCTVFKPTQKEWLLNQKGIRITLMFIQAKKKEIQNLKVDFRYTSNEKSQLKVVKLDMKVLNMLKVLYVSLISVNKLYLI